MHSCRWGTEEAWALALRGGERVAGPSFCSVGISGTVPENWHQGQHGCEMASLRVSRRKWAPWRAETDLAVVLQGHPAPNLDSWQPPPPPNIDRPRTSVGVSYRCKPNPEALLPSVLSSRTEGLLTPQRRAGGSADAGRQRHSPNCATTQPLRVFVWPPLPEKPLRPIGSL